MDRKCLMIFHNGSDHEIDLGASGVPVLDWKNKVLWTFRGRFRLDPTITDKVKSAHLFLSARPWKNKDLSNFVQREAAQFSHDIDPTVITDCWLYLLLLHYDHDNSNDYDQDSHASNYWKSQWISIASKNVKIQNIQAIPKETTSYFLILGKSDPPAALPTQLFEQSINLHVLRLSLCTFSFASPPFICCSNLRFIFIDSCRDEDAVFMGKGDDKQDTEWAFLKRLWVLDIRRTCWDWILSPLKMVLMIELRELNLMDAVAGRSVWGINTLDLTRLCNLQRLRMIRSSTFFTALELLDLSGNSDMEVLPNLSAASGLKVLILDGCNGLQHVEPDTVSASLESCSFDGFGPASRWMSSLQIPEMKVRPSAHDNQELPKVSKISLEGCARLKSVFFRGLPNLEELDLSETAIEALDLEVMQVKKLQRLFLIGCEKLYRVQWLDARNPPLKLLSVDTRGRDGRLMDGDCHRSHSSQKDFVQVVATDARFLRGFGVLGNNFHLHLSSTVSDRKLPETKETRISSSDASDLLSVVGSSSPYVDVLDKLALSFYPLERHIEFANGGCNWELKSGREIMASLMDSAQSFHVHSNSSITAANLEAEYESQFTNLRWCRIEWCSKLRSAFLVDNRFLSTNSFKSIETFWASHLFAAHCIWSRCLSFSTYGTETAPAAFSKLRYIYLHSCPRITFVLPWSFRTLASLETIHITYCGGLATNIEFPSLRNIHLHELPMLQDICETNMSAPVLENIKLRGCWSLRQLPAIHVGRAHDKSPAVVDCEKDWWDKLHWDGLEASRDLFSLRDSHYYKKTIPRGSLLR
ncbi:hypothetical protein BRADI_3g14540v3 [Brachypodium distachyon]|uniref:Uncharacterized protein n=1 Tax=Brachypodium distachyon TaxID=15368 RepID=A0A2K2CX41_BRADI|nr:hypothetical protein BRADI_3g14540v3 [Brachypodium distachyon]